MNTEKTLLTQLRNVFVAIVTLLAVISTQLTARPTVAYIALAMIAALTLSGLVQIQNHLKKLP